MSKKSINDVVKNKEKDVESKHRMYANQFNNLKIDNKNISFDEVEEYSEKFEPYNKFNS